MRYGIHFHYGLILVLNYNLPSYFIRRISNSAKNIQQTLLIFTEDVFLCHPVMRIWESSGLLSSRGMAFYHPLFSYSSKGSVITSLYFFCVRVPLGFQRVYIVGLNNCDEYRMILEDSLDQTRSTGSRANNCSLCTHESPLHLCGCKTNTIIASFHKNFFFF